MLLAGCSSQRSIQAAALVGGKPIAWSDYQKYLDYSLRFYAWARRPAQNWSLRCDDTSRTPACARLRQEVLARLIQERVVLSYASTHHIALSRSDRRRIDIELDVLLGGSSGPAITDMRVDRSFLRDLLAREMLVRRVQESVVSGRASSGPSFHVRKFIIPRSPSRPDAQAFKGALDLATDGQPVPAGTQVRDEWVAAFRLGDRELKALTAAQPGQYTGPFTGPRAYVVIQLLGEGSHAYGRPARDMLQARYFQAWLRAAIRRAAPTCFTRTGARAVCPASDY